MTKDRTCAVNGCTNPPTEGALCDHCSGVNELTGFHSALMLKPTSPVPVAPQTMAQKYPKYYKPVPPGVTELDVYGVCAMFPITDPSGAINHARKKLLVPGTRTGGKSLRDDIREARDTLNRWLELNPE